MKKVDSEKVSTAWSRTFIVAATVVCCGYGARLEAPVASGQDPLPHEMEQELYNRASGLFNPDALPAGSPFIPERAICGTPIVMALASNWDRLSRTTQEAFAHLFARPSTQKTYTSSGGRFKIHYDETGTHAVSTVDANRNGTPDYVDEVSATFEYSWQLQVGQLGYSAPLSDGDDVYDVYIRNLAPQQVYGLTYPEGTGTTKSSYMHIDNNYTDSIYQTKGSNGLRVTVAHEFFHAVQFGYYADISTGGWWHEVTATWMEDVAYDDVNDYHQYTQYFYNSPEESLDSTSLHMFGAAVFAHHLEQVYGKDCIRDTWDALKTQAPTASNVTGAINGTMPMGGFAAVYPRFAAWNYLTGSRTVSGYYDEAAAYPLVDSETALPGPGAPVTDSGRMDHLGASYVRVQTAALTGGLRCAFTLSTSTEWQVLVLLISGEQVEVVWAADPARIEVANVKRYDEVVFIPMVLALTGQRFSYSYTLTLDSGIAKSTDLVGDLDANQMVNFNDFVTFAQGFVRKPVDSEYDQRLDFNADGEVNFSDFVIFARHFGE